MLQVQLSSCQRCYGKLGHGANSILQCILIKVEFVAVMLRCATHVPTVHPYQRKHGGC